MSAMVEKPPQNLNKGFISCFRKIIFSTCAVYLSQGFYWQGSLINYLLSKTDRTGRSYV